MTQKSIGESFSELLGKTAGRDKVRSVIMSALPSHTICHQIPGCSQKRPNYVAKRARGTKCYQILSPWRSNVDDKKSLAIWQVHFLAPINPETISIDPK